MSTVHPPTDPRIIYKIAPSLSLHYEVICALPNLTNGKPAFSTISLPFFKQLFARLLITYPVLLWKCIRLKPDILHIFVPELIPAALLFQWLGAKVVYEVQENLYQKFSIKKYNNALIFQLFFHYFDRLARRKFFLVFTDKAYLNTYAGLKYPFAVIQNFAAILPADFHRSDNKQPAHPEFFYAGVISMERCIDVMILAFAKLKTRYPNFKVHLFGSLRVDRDFLKTLTGYDLVCDNLVFYGYTDQQVAFRYAARCIAGIALLKPVADYPESFTTKLFEYMALGMPVITSDFPLYRSIVEPSQSGFCISPYDDAALFESMILLIENEIGRAEMGNRGRICVEKFYNWEQETQKLLSFYVHILATKKDLS